MGFGGGFRMFGGGLSVSLCWGGTEVCCRRTVGWIVRISAEFVSVILLCFRTYKIVNWSQWFQTISKTLTQTVTATVPQFCPLSQ